MLEDGEAGKAVKRRREDAEAAQAVAQRDSSVATQGNEPRRDGDEAYDGVNKAQEGHCERGGLPVGGNNRLPNVGRTEYPLSRPR